MMRKWECTEEGAKVVSRRVKTNRLAQLSSERDKLTKQHPTTNTHQQKRPPNPHYEEDLSDQARVHRSFVEPAQEVRLREDVERSVSEVDKCESGEAWRSTGNGVGEEDLGWRFGWGERGRRDKERIVVFGFEDEEPERSEGWLRTNENERD